MPKIVPLVIGAGIAAAIFYAGISSLVGGSDGGDKDQVEAIIGRQLPKRLARIQGSGVKTRSLSCTETDAGHFICDAKLQPSEAVGESELLDLTLHASCDSASCGWEVVKKSISNRVGSETAGRSENGRPPGDSPSSELAEPEYGWSTMTCGEVREAVEQKDLEWLGAAGRAVAYTAISSLPRGDEERLTVEGARATVSVCRKATNPGYQPYETAEAALVEQLERNRR